MEYPPSEAQLKYCYDILERVKECPADEDGQPLFETSLKEADKFIKQHRHQPCPVHSETTVNDWGGLAADIHSGSRQ